MGGTAKPPTEILHPCGSFHPGVTRMLFFDYGGLLDVEVKGTVAGVQTASFVIVRHCRRLMECVRAGEEVEWPENGGGRRLLMRRDSASGRCAHSIQREAMALSCGITQFMIGDLTLCRHLKLLRSRLCRCQGGPPGQILRGVKDRRGSVS
jgi:hypothetical protein